MDENVEAGGREVQISPDDILSVVGNEQRRAILNSLLSTAAGTLDYSALVDRVADRTGEETEPVSDDYRHRIRIALHHTHLPKLEAVRLIDVEAETGRVQFAGDDLDRDLLRIVESYEE